jgi:beta-glucanase (GH16 family)
MPRRECGSPVIQQVPLSTGQRFGRTGSWPRDGEDDIMEVLSRKTCFAYHYSGGVHGPVCTARKSGWHTFASDWEPGVVKYFYDGVKVGTFTSGITSSPHYLILNHALGNSLIQVPSRVQVDYVRVWQH